MSKIHSDTSFPMCKHVVEEIKQNKYTETWICHWFGLTTCKNQGRRERGKNKNKLLTMSAYLTGKCSYEETTWSFLGKATTVHLINTQQPWDSQNPHLPGNAVLTLPVSGPGGLNLSVYGILPGSQVAGASLSRTAAPGGALCQGHLPNYTLNKC